MYMNEQSNWDIKYKNKKEKMCRRWYCRMECGENNEIKDNEVAWKRRVVGYNAQKRLYLYKNYIEDELMLLLHDKSKMTKKIYT